MPEVAGLVRVSWINNLMEHDIVRHPLSFIYSSLIFSLTFPGCYNLLINSPGTMGISYVLWFLSPTFTLALSRCLLPRLKINGHYKEWAPIL